MKLHTFLITLLALTIVVSCSKDDLDFDYDPGIMHYDGPNANAPLLFAQTNTYAAMFPRGVLRQYESERIDAVQLYIFNIPESSVLIFYRDGSGGRPGDKLLELDITAELRDNQWNTIVLPEPFAIPSSGGLWIALQVTDTKSIQVMGCDAGPNRDGGDWLHQSDDSQWRTFRDRSGDSINWNIRALIE